MNIISIDPSKIRTGVFTIIDEKESSLLLENKRNIPQEEALICIYNFFNYILNNNHFDIGLIEGYGFNPKNRKSIIPMCEIGGVIKLIFNNALIPLITIPVMTWKTLTIGKYKIDKRKNPDEYLRMIEFKYEKSFESIDEADAFLIYISAKEIGKRTKYLTPSMKKIRKQISDIIAKKMVKG